MSAGTETATARAAAGAEENSGRSPDAAVAAANPGNAHNANAVTTIRPAIPATTPARARVRAIAQCPRLTLSPSHAPVRAQRAGSVRTALATAAAGREYDHAIVGRDRFALAVLVRGGHPEQLVRSVAADRD